MPQPRQPRRHSLRCPVALLLGLEIFLTGVVGCDTPAEAADHRGRPGLVPSSGRRRTLSLSEALREVTGARPVSPAPEPETGFQEGPGDLLVPFSEDYATRRPLPAVAGPQLVSQEIRPGMIDASAVFTSPVVLGGSTGAVRDYPHPVLCAPWARGSEACRGNSVGTATGGPRHDAPRESGITVESDQSPGLPGGLFGGSGHTEEVLEAGPSRDRAGVSTEEDAPEVVVPEDSCGDSGSRPVRPVDGPITDHFGWSSWRGRNHDGMDYGVGVGTPVRAALGGKVHAVQYDSGYGNYLVLLHDDGSMTTYNHLQKSLVNPGERVCTGQVVAHSGATGAGTGPHLHFERWVPGNCSYPVVGARCPTDPAPWLG